MPRFIESLFWVFVVTLVVTFALMFADIARSDGAVCDTDLSCAEYTIKLCEETQEPWDCQFSGTYLSDATIAQACREFLDVNEREALACSVWHSAQVTREAQVILERER